MDIDSLTCTRKCISTPTHKIDCLFGNGLRDQGWCELNRRGTDELNKKRGVQVCPALPCCAVRVPCVALLCLALPCSVLQNDAVEVSHMGTENLLLTVTLCAL